MSIPRSLWRRAAIVIAMMAGLVAVSVPAAFAHAHLHAGEYEIVVGWGDEPAYAGFKNSVQLTVSDHDGKPVAGLTNLNVEVSFGTQKETLKLEPQFGTPGEYRATIVPTTAGTYSFHLTGTIRAQKLDLTVTSGEKTFSNVDETAEIQFPQKVPNGTELAERIDREIPRVRQDLSARVAAVKDDASQANLFAIIALVVGALGVLLGGVSALRKR